MINQYPLWKYLLILGVLLFGIVYALPNLYGQDPAVQISSRGGEPVGAPIRDKAVATLEKADIRYKSVTEHDGRLLIRFHDSEAQLRGRDLLEVALGGNYVVALNLAPSTPGWLRAINARPMYLGLDLRGGVHFLMAVDMRAALQQALGRHVGDLRSLLQGKRIRYLDVSRSKDAIQMRFRDARDLDRARSLIQARNRDLVLSTPS
ncbi:MAG TPA: protein translocase subunit SecD, partial [Chromatiales bacterium]|nr:protein translocase subunit SecD [Chromatiales bacterium]